MILREKENSGYVVSGLGRHLEFSLHRDGVLDRLGSNNHVRVVGMKLEPGKHFVNIYSDLINL